MDTNKPKLNIGFFFLSLGTLIALITSVVSFLNLVFSTLDKQFPDVLNSTYQYGYVSADFENIRVALATLIIFFPIFLIIFYFWKKFTKGELGHTDEIIRKWVTYIILFLSAIVVAVDLVILVRYFVSGEITSRFIYKVITTLVVASLVGKYFYVSEFWKYHKKWGKIFIVIYNIFAVLLVVGAIVYSFSVMGSPAQQRALRLDEKRVNDLQSIQYQIINYWQQKEKLPIDLKELTNPIAGFSLPVPPDFTKGEKYEYIVTDKNKLTFELCANFSLPIPKGWVASNRGEVVPMATPGATSAIYPPIPAGGFNDSWDHQAGRTCFSRTIDKDLYPPYPKVLKNN